MDASRSWPPKHDRATSIPIPTPVTSPGVGQWTWPERVPVSPAPGTEKANAQLGTDPLARVSVGLWLVRTLGPQLLGSKAKSCPQHPNPTTKIDQNENGTIGFDPQPHPDHRQECQECHCPRLDDLDAGAHLCNLLLAESLMTRKEHSLQGRHRGARGIRTSPWLLGDMGLGVQRHSRSNILRKPWLPQLGTVLQGRQVVPELKTNPGRTKIMAISQNPLSASLYLSSPSPHRLRGSRLDASHRNHAQDIQGVGSAAEKKKHACAHARSWGPETAGRRSGTCWAAPGLAQRSNWQSGRALFLLFFPG